MRYLIIHNPNSGFGSDAIFEFERMLVQPGDECCVRMLDRRTPAEAVLTDAESFDICVLSGGDGSVSSMLYSLANRDVSACIFPSGTANLLFTNIGNAYEPASLARACHALATVPLDLGEISWTDQDGTEHVRGFSLMGGMGYDAQLMHAALPNKQAMGQTAYFAAVLSEPDVALADFTVTIDGTPHSHQGISCMVADTATLQGDVDLVPDCRLDDGLLDVVVAETADVGGLAKPLFASLLDRRGKTLGRPSFSHRRGAVVEVRSSVPLPFEVDGEAIEGLVSGYRARILEKAVRMVVDPSSPYYPKPE